MNFVFMQVGQDNLSDLLVRSIRKWMPNSPIIQCSDNSTPKIVGVDEIFRCKADASKLMTFRLTAFAQLALEGESIFIDSDMLMVKPFDMNVLREPLDVLVCQRSFMGSTFFNPKSKKMDLFEYEGRTLNEVYPFLACFTLTKTKHYWPLCLERLTLMHAKFHEWYGDQEAIKSVVFSPNGLKIGSIAESKVACLPEFAVHQEAPYFLHFKGKKRKALMQQYANELL